MKAKIEIDVPEYGFELSKLKANVVVIQKTFEGYVKVADMFNLKIVEDKKRESHSSD